MASIFNDETVYFDFDSLVQPLIFSSSLDNSKIGFNVHSLQHWHSKTNVVPIEATYAIVMIQLPDYIGGCLAMIVLPIWRQCVLDRFAPVHKTITKSFEKISLALVRLNNKEEKFCIESHF